MGDSEAYYTIETKSGNIKHVRKREWIESPSPSKVRIDDMTDIGKLTHLLWGYNIKDKNGKIYRKYKFLAEFPDKAKKILDIIYPKYHEYDVRAQKSYQECSLNDDIFKYTGFTVVATKELR